MVNTNFKPFPNLFSDRLLYQQLQERDLDVLFDYQSKKENFPYVHMTVYKETSEVLDYIHKMNAGIDQEKWIIWGLYLKDSKKMIGTISIWNLNHETMTAEFGYGLYPNYRGQGYMFEALKRCIQYGFEKMHLKTLEAYTNVENKDSRMLLNAVGFHYSRTIHEDNTEMAVYII